MDSKRRFIVVKGGSISTAGSEDGSGTGSLILLVAILIGGVIAATSLIIGIPGSLEAASSAVATSEPKSPPVGTFHEQYPVQASETTIDPPTF